MKNDVDIRDDNREQSDRQDREIGALEALWSFFSSMKTAIVLLLLLAAASVAGTVIAQNQAPEVYIKAYGQGKYGLLKSLGLTDVYHSTWFMMLLGLVGMNLAVCSINRFGIAWRRTFRPKVFADLERVSSMPRSEEFSASGSVENAAAKVSGALRSRSYHVVKSSEGDGVALHAAKGRISIWGPYLTHLSILVIFAGAVFGSLLGSEGYTTITEGKETGAYYLRDNEQQKDLGFRVALRKFTIEYDKDHNPTAYKSDLRVYDGGKLVTQKVVDVNHPLSYRGVSFYQVDYGIEELVLKVTTPKGDVARVPFSIGTQDTPQGRVYGVSDSMWKQVKLGGKKLTLFVHNIAPDYVGGTRINASMLPINPAANIFVNEKFPEDKSMDAWVKLGWLAKSDSAEYKGYKVELEDVVDYTVLQVSRNPALPVIYFGFGLMILGVFISFYVAHKVIRVSIAPTQEGVTVLAGATSRAEPVVFDKDFSRMRDALS